MASHERPTRRYGLHDWIMNMNTLSTNAQRQREASNDIRQETRTQSFLMATKTSYDQLFNTYRLSDRMNDVNAFKILLNRLKNVIDYEIGAFQASNDALDNFTRNILTPKECVVECLTIRDRRRNIDLVVDEPEAELRREKELLDNISNRLQEKKDLSFEQVRLLKEIRNQTMVDLEHKIEALEIDLEQFNLRPNAIGVSLKPNSTRIPPGTVTQEQWSGFSNYTFQRGFAEITAAHQFRDAVYAAIVEMASEIETQAQSTERALRRRRHEIEQALDEGNWQKSQIEDEIREVERELERVDSTIQELSPPERLAQTRLERRTYRPGMELCLDAAQLGLTNEVQQIQVSREVLLEKQRQCRQSLNTLQYRLQQINDDIALKQRSLAIENECITLRHQRMDRDDSATEPMTNSAAMERDDSATEPMTNSAAMERNDSATVPMTNSAAMDTTYVDVTGVSNPPTEPPPDLASSLLS